MHHHIPEWNIALIVALYICIAGCFAWYGRGTSGPAKRATTYLLGIFLVCALSGYLPRLVPLPHHVVGLTHIALLPMCAAFILTGQARHIANLFDHD